MDSKLLHFTTNTPHTSLPFFLSCPSPSYLKRPTFSAPKALLSLPSNQLQRTPFWGTTLVSHETHLTEDKWRKTRLPFLPVRAAVKWRKERPLDNVIQRDKKLKLVLKIRSILVNQPDRIMNLKALGRYRKDLGLTRKRRFIALLKRFPGVFEIVEEGVYSLKFRLTPEAEKVYLEELRARNEMEDLLVVKLRKLLMMSLEKRILLEKIAHLKTDLGLPVEFRTTICERYPQYFKVVRTDRGPALELTHWDPALAVSAAEVNEEEKRVREMAERNLIIDRPLKFRRVKLPRGLNLSKGEMRRISMFREMPYISPYADFSHLRSGSNEKEKHACGVVEELLSLTLEKKTLVDHLTHFREEFRFSQQVRGMLIRHPDMFYVSLKGERDSVFLREAYQDSQLIDKDKLLIAKEKMRSLVAVPRFARRFGSKTEGADDGSVDGSEEDDDEGWSDADGSLIDGLDFDDDDEEEDDDDDGEDDWSDDEELLSSDLDKDGNQEFEQRKVVKSVDVSTKAEEKILDPVFPDGRPRERW
ncbi:hypothetical protein QJS10_CPB20g02047 [Acorus calamus]|uniref:PORR domain-containing protein n=1 Tax=Acorus calamus TaxID=4465 RepID=A0AAV9C7Y8_ACOCL|nr:hypothetical protein QJS10_CPB20g02047 [Acorus calamus]